MKKAKVTQEQAEAIEIIKSDDKKYGCFEANLRVQVEKGWTGNIFECLNEIKTEDYVRALFVGYEVEPEYKVGDWVIYKRFNGENLIGRIERDVDSNELAIKLAISDDPQLGIIKFITRHATTEEIATEKTRRWWSNNNRDVWELKRGDLIASQDKGVSSIREVKRAFGEGGVITLPNHAVYGRKELETFFKLVCFAEDRKDIKGDK